MIINQNTNDVLRIGEETDTKQATINADKMSKLQHMLTSGLYNDPISACMVELANNAIDSIIQSGKDPIQNPSIVNLYKDGVGYFLSITDKGLGLNKVEFETVVMSYLTSTKEDSDSTIGHFGIGAKSFVGLNRPTEWTCRKDGMEYKFLAYKGVEFLEYDTVYEKPTTEENGVEIKMRINDWSEYSQFCTKAKAKLAYYDEITLIVDGRIVENKIYRNDLFQWCDNVPYNEVHFTLKDVLYKINWTNLGIPAINVPLCLRFHLTDGFTPTISREDIIYNQYTKDKILEKIKDVATFFVNKYNETTEFETFSEAFLRIGEYDTNVKLLDRVFSANQLVQYSSVPRNNITVKGITHLSLTLIKSIRGDMFNEYVPIAIDSREEIWKRDKLYRTTSLGQIFFDTSTWGNHRNYKVVEIDEDIVGNTKAYMRYKYGASTMYVMKTNTFKVDQDPLSKRESLYGLLQLRSVPNDKWDVHIAEFNMILNELTSKFKQEFNIESNPNYIKWLDDKKRQQKEDRALGITKGTYKGLNKAKGDITVKVAREYKYGGKISWDRATRPIADLHKTKGLIAYGVSPTDFPDTLYYYTQLFPNTSFVILNPTEVKHVTPHHQFKTFNEFMNTKPFSRLGTALYAKQVLALCPDETGIIQDTFPKFCNLEDKINAFINSYYVSAHAVLEQAIIDELKESGKWDMNIYPEIEEYRKIMSTFGFMNYLKPSNYKTSDEEKKVIQNMMYVMLKHNKVTNATIETMELVPKSSLCIDGVNDEDLVPVTAELDIVSI